MKSWWILITVLCAGASIFLPRFLEYLFETDLEHYDLVIGILSSRDHFLHRKIIRNALKFQILTTSINVTYKFIVGKKQCDVPVGNRRDPFSCLADPFIKAFSASYYTQLPSHPKSDDQLVYGYPIGLDFEVIHDVVLVEVGLYDYQENGFSEALNIILYDTIKQKLVITIPFVPFNNGELVGNMRYKSIKNILLPKGFRGTLVVEGTNWNDPVYKDQTCNYNTADGMLHFIKGYRYGNEEGVFPRLFTHEPNYPCYLNGVSMKLKPPDDVVNRNASEISLERLHLYERWERLRLEEENHLSKEQLLHNDLVYVPVTESYRNLPTKLLQFYKWVFTNYHFQYLMKTDDDCFINLHFIQKYLQSLLKKKESISNWIGNFREYFPLDLYGKWKEHNYKSSTYPPFACGSGYIMSHDIIQWLVKNEDRLKIYQGEDTSLGIWLAAIQVNYIQNDMFKCFHSNSTYVFTTPENNLQQLHQLYEKANEEFFNKRFR